VYDDIKDKDATIVYSANEISKEKGIYFVFNCKYKNKSLGIVWVEGGS
jgi:hypothetical protein